ncbi:MAG: hypothetical protein JWQ01_4935 [Massilia sp.]|nr:hypothetical protein [Massilia sp.]
MITTKEIEAAIGRIGQTSDGRFLRLGLQRAMMAIAPSPEPGALQTFEGGRRFAAQLERLLAGSNAEMPSDYANESALDRPVAIARPGAVSAGRSGGTRRRVAAADPDTGK